MNLVTFVIPIYNEGHILPKLLSELVELQGNLKVTEFLIVDDGSTDGTLEILGLQSGIPYKVLLTNVGKGGAVKAGIVHSTTQFVGIFDGDLEYDPQVISRIDEYARLHQESHFAIFASRYLGKNLFDLLRHSDQQFSSVLMNQILVFIYRTLFNVRLTDPLTGVKLYPREFVNSLSLTRNRFDGDHEIAVELIKSGIHIVELPVKYIPRTKAEGKKIGLKDAFMAVRTLIVGRLNS